MLYAFLVSAMHAAYSAHLVLLHDITRLVMSTVTVNLIHSAVTRHVLQDSNILTRYAVL
jgi:hypothetical protein